MLTKMVLIGLGVLVVYNLISVMVYGYYCAECKALKKNIRVGVTYVLITIWPLIVILDIEYGFYRFGYQLNRKIHTQKFARKVKRTYKEIVNPPIKEGK